MFQHLVQTADLGTPISESSEMIQLSIDGKIVQVPKGTSVMRAAMENGIPIPKLCATDSLEAFGSCRLCLVEIEGKRGYPSSCTTPVEEGMQVQTQTSALQDLRRSVMELTISDHPLDCLTCSANGDCELQSMAAMTGIRGVRFREGKNHLDSTIDDSNPYFQFDSSKCIVCNRCIRACEEIQGTFALTIAGRGFDARVTAGMNQSFLDSNCVSCGACVNACPTATLQEKTIVTKGLPQQSTLTTCAYCGVGCMFKAESHGEEVIRMTPWKEGKANEGHACVKGRFAWNYVSHEDRMRSPMIRDKITDPWKKVSWDEAFTFAADRIKQVQKTYGIDSVGGITSSRCTNEETYLVQKLIRAALGTNNVDTCARVCHSPTGYGLGQTFGTSAGTQDFESVMHADVIVVIGANPTDAHPVFASRLKKRVRAGAQLIIIDPRTTELVESPHIRARYHLALRPGTNVALLNAIAHTIVKEQWMNQSFINERCDTESFQEWLEFIQLPEHAPEVICPQIGVDAASIRGAAQLYAQGNNSAIYYGLGVTEHAQGSTAVIAIANLAMLCGMIGRQGVGVNPLRGQNNVQGSCDMGSFPHEFPGYRHVSDTSTRTLFEQAWQTPLSAHPGLRIPNMFDAAVAGSFKALYCQGEDIVQSDPNTAHVTAALSAMDCVIVQDIFLNETAKYAHVFFPGSSFLEKDGTFTNAERRISRVRKVATPIAGLADWEVTQKFSQALGYPMHYEHPEQIMEEIARLTPSFAGVSYQAIDTYGSVQWPCHADTPPEGLSVMHLDKFVRGLGRFLPTAYVPSDEKVTMKYPLLLTTGRILSQYNVGAQTRRTFNTAWHEEDVLDIHPEDAAERGIQNGDWVSIESRAGLTQLRARVTEKIPPGVVYTTFHFPQSGANVVTTDSSDWATNCPEYKVTAVQVNKAQSTLSEWQKEFHAFHAEQMQHLETAHVDS